MTKKECKAKLEELGIDYPSDSNKDELIELYENAIAEIVPEFEENEEEVKEVKEEKQASLNQCMRQFVGKKPFSGSKISDK